MITVILQNMFSNRQPHWALPDKKKCPPPPIEVVRIPDFLRVSRTGIPENCESLRPHFQICLIKFDQIPSFCHNFQDFKLNLDLAKVVPYFTTLTQFCGLDFQVSFAANFDILYGGRAFYILE